MKKIIILTGILAGSFFYTAKAEGNGFGLFQEQEQSPEQTAANVEYHKLWILIQVVQEINLLLLTSIFRY